MKYTVSNFTEKRETCKGCCCGTEEHNVAVLDGNSLQCEEVPNTMRLYIRNKVKYDPLNAGKPLIFVDFPDPRGFSVGQVKEEFKKKVRAAKVDSLYHRQGDGSYEVLADDRTVGFYNIQDNAILETTSNPLWAATIYYRLREVERDAANQPDDARTGRGLEQSSIQKFMALGILFNGGGNNPEQQQQPPYFEELDQLYEHLQTAGKKPVHMSQKTLDTLQTLKNEYEQNDIHERDSIGHFVDRQAVKLGLTSKSNGSGDDQHGGSTGGGQEQGTPLGGNGRGNRRTNGNKGQRQAGQGRVGRRAPQKQRTCEDCEENVATQFCADCLPPLVLCDECAVILHRGVTRRNHQLKDVSEAPTPARSKGYTPKAYRAPFAMLVAFHRAANEVPNKMSLTSDELKLRAQPLTNTDLEIKQGRWFGGFDSLENALMKNELVQKEARTPKYSLVEKGQPLAARCSGFDYAVQNLTQAASVPIIPVTGARPVLENRQVCLLVDSEEPLRERFVRVAHQKGLSARTRKLPVGDFVWVLLPPGVNPDTVRDMPDQELVLPMLVERKTWDDLWSSLKTTRFINQVQRMKRCGLKNLFYLVEGSPKELKGKPGPEVETYLQDKIDSLLLDEQFFVNRTGSWLKTVEWLCHLTNMSIESLQAAGGSHLKTYSEFSRGGKLTKAITRTDHAAPVTSIVWSATEFTDAIRSHSLGGNKLRDLPVSGEEERSLIVIQGLTVYNKQCHKLVDISLADLLENTHQTAEACVQRHLQGATDSLIYEDVTQWYILWLQVCKGVIVRRTESEEESADILCKFYQNTTGGADALPYDDGEVGIFHEEPEEHLERLPEDELIFANDSQEEAAMIRQTLSHSLLEKPPSSTTTKGSSSSSSHGGSHTISASAMNEREQLELAMELSRLENVPTESCSSSAKTMINPSQELKPSTNVKVPKSTHTAVCSYKTGSGSTDDELEKALKLSLEEFEHVTQRQHLRATTPGTADDLEKALELSKMEYEQLRKGSAHFVLENHDDTFDRDAELEKVLELSKLESEGRDREQHYDGLNMGLREADAEESSKEKRSLMITNHVQNGTDSTFFGEHDLEKALEVSKVEYKQKAALGDKDQRRHPVSIEEEGLATALQLSKLDLQKLKGDVLGQPKGKRPPKNGVQDTDDDVANALEQSKMEWSKKQSKDGDLEKALELSRNEYIQSNIGSLDRKHEGLNSDVIVLEECDDGLQSRDLHVTHCNQSTLLVVEESYVPSSVSSDHEWDPEGENRDNMFEALNPATSTGNTKDSAILLDSQEPLDNTMDDFSYALKVQEELNEEVNRSSSNRLDSSRTEDITGTELTKQLKGYRELQKQKYGQVSGRRDKFSPGLDFRRNAAAIACGKPVQIGIASPITSSRLTDSHKGSGSGRVLGQKPLFTSTVDTYKSGFPCSVKRNVPCTDEVHFIRDDVEGFERDGSPIRNSLKNSCDKSLVSHSGAMESPRPFSSSASSCERVHKPPSFAFSGPCSPPPATASFSVSPSLSSVSSPQSHSRSTSDKPVGPKCGACGELGHNKNSKMCPHYFSAEAVQRREEQSRKRKAKKEEEEREFNDGLGALAAQRLTIEEQSRILGEQLDQLRRQSQNMADTQKKVEDAIKRRRKR